MKKMISTRFVFLVGLLGLLMPFGQAEDSFLAQFDRFEPLPRRLYSPGKLEEDRSGFNNHTYPRTEPFPSHYRDYGLFLRPADSNADTGGTAYVNEIEARMAGEGKANLGERIMWTDSAGTPLPYFLLMPPGYDPNDTETTYPLLLVIHGQGGLGGSTPTWEAEFLALEENRQQFPMFVLSPTFPSRPTTNPDEDGVIHPTAYFDAFMELIDELMTDERIDSERIYSTGFSMGGNTTWTILFERPELLAAAAPFAGAAGVFDATRTAERVAEFKDTAIWGGIGIHDYIGASWGPLGSWNGRLSYERVRDAGHGAIRMWEVTDLDHSSRVHQRRLLATVDWMFSLRRGDAIEPGFMHVPYDVTAEMNDSVRFEGWAFGRPEATHYEWRRDGVVIVGEDGPLLELEEIGAADAGKYTVTAFFPDGSSITSPEGRLEVLAARAPEVISAPAFRSALEGDAIELAVDVAGSMPYGFSWEHDGQPLSDGAGVEGAETSTLTLSDLTTEDSGTYTLTITNAVGSATVSIELAVEKNFYYEANRVRAWIPDEDTLPVIRGILFAGNGAGSNNKVAANNPLLQDWALQKGFVVMGTAAGNLGEDDAWNQFMSSLNSVINDSGRLELHHAPVLYWGHSMGGQQAYGMARRIPERMVAFIVNKGANYVKESGVDPWNVPALMIAGETDSDLRRDNIRNLYLEGRAEGAPWALLEEYRQSHSTGNSMHIAFGFFEDILPLRYPEDPANVPTNSTSPTLLTLDQNDGWLVKTGHPEWSTGFVDIFPQQGYTGDPLAHGWVPTRGVAYLYRALASYVNPNITVRNNQGKYFFHDLPYNPREGFSGETDALGRFAPGEPILYGFDLVGSPDWTEIRIYSYDELIHTIPASSGTRFEVELLLDADQPSHAVHMVMDLADGSQRTSFIYFFTPRELEPLAFARAPWDSSAFAGETVRLHAAVTGTGPVSYQWYKDGSAIAGATEHLLELADLSAGDEGDYTLHVSGPNGQILISEPATVSLGEGSTVWQRINFQLPHPPAPRGWLADSGELFGDRGNGETYGWLEEPFAVRNRYNLVPPSPSFLYDSLAIMRGRSWAIEVPNGKYRVRLVSGDPEFPAGRQSFTLNGEPLYSISTNAEHIWADGVAAVWVWENELRIDPTMIAVDEKVAFLEVERIYQTVSASEAVITATPESGLLPLAVDFSTHRSWIKTGESITEASWDFGDGSSTVTGETVTHTFTDPGDFIVTLTLTDSSGAVSTATKTISVGVPVPVITTQPEPQTLPVGDTLTLTAAAGGYGTLTYQWTRNGTPVAGQNAATLEISNAQTSDAGLYRVEVTNDGGTVNSGSVDVEVIPVPGVPQNLAAEAQGSSQVLLSWDEPEPFTDAVVVQRAESAGGPWTTIGTVDRAFTTFSDTNRDPVTTYDYRILAENQFFESEASAAVSVTTDNVPGGEWTFTMDITIDGYEGGGVLENFPVLVRFDEAMEGFSFADFADPQGGDLRFVNGDGTRELSYEIDTWNENGAAAVWVRVPQIEAEGDTVISALWGNEDATVPPAYTNNGSVWEGNYRAVWHLQEDENERMDSTAFAHHATPAGPLAVQPGVVGRSARFDGSDGNTFLSIGQELSDALAFTNQFTLEGWMRIDAGAGTQYRFAYTVGDPYWTGSGYRVDFNTTRMRTSIGTEFGVGGGNARQTHDTDFPGGVPEEEWFHFAVVWNGNQISTYFNGQHAKTETFPHEIDYPDWASDPLVLGGGIFGDNPAINRSLAGNLDEMRISITPKSADWIAATYKNILNTDQFLTLGNVETTAPAPVIDAQPQGLNLNVGDEATFVVQASSDEPISYQWQKDGQDIDGATSATFTIPSAGVSDSGAYRVAVSNINGTTLSVEVALVVNGTVPNVSEWPTASTLEFGQSLADATLSGGVADTAGSFAFADPSLTPEVGTHNQTVVFTPEDDFTYESVSSEIPVTVEPAAATVTLSDLTVSYNGEPQSPTVTTDPAGLDVSITYDGSSTVPTDAGSYAVAVTVTDPNASGSASDTFMITTASLTIRADDTGKFEGDPDPPLTWTVTSGALFGDDTLSGSLVRAGGEEVGSYAITQGTLTATANYVLSFQSGTFSILEVGDAPWVLQADFDDLNSGTLRGQGGWTGNNDNAAQVIVDPDDDTNQIFRFAPGTNNTVSKTFSTAIQTGEVATLFFRFYVPAGGTRINQQIRLPNNQPIRLKWDTDPSEPVLWLFGEDMNAPGQQQIEQSIDRDTWYNFWMVIDNVNGTYRIYLQGGDFTEQTFVTVNNMGSDPNSHPFETGTLDAMTFIGWNNGPMLYDDFYLAFGGENLSNPVAGLVAPSDYEVWLDDQGLDAGTDPEAEDPGTGLTYRQLHIMGARRVEGTWEDLLRVVPPAVMEAGGIDLRVQARAGRRYQLFFRNDLMDQEEGWQALGEAVPVTDTDQEIEFQDLNPGSRRFYRVQVDLIQD